MNLSYEKPDGERLVPSLCLIDSGYDADSTYDFCADNADWAMPCKGASNPMRSHFKLSKINRADTKAFGMNLVMVDGDKYKDMIAARMKKQNGRGAWMVYKGCDMEYAEQVTAEHKVNVKVGARTVQRWKPKHSHADNHFLDCEVYALAAADLLDIRSMHLEDASGRTEIKQQPAAKTDEESWIEQNESWI